MAFQKSGHLVRCPTKKNNANKVPRCFFSYVGTKTFASSCKNLNFLPKRGQIWLKICFLRESKEKKNMTIPVMYQSIGKGPLNVLKLNLAIHHANQNVKGKVKDLV